MTVHSYTEGNGPWHILGARKNTQGQASIVVDKYGRPRVSFDTVSWDEMPTCDESVYSDRLYQWNPKKHDEATQKHFGNQSQHWDRRTPAQISAWLTDYFDKPCEFVALWQGNNASSGFPYWLIFFNSSEARQ